MTYYAYSPDVRPCPRCQCCEEHQDKTPRETTGYSYFRVEDDGTRTILTAEEYRNRFRGETK